MKALTISQPFAFLIADGQKPVENRSWPTNAWVQWAATKDYPMEENANSPLHCNPLLARFIFVECLI